MDDAKTVVITGATSGIGLATAREFAAKGYNLVLAARRTDELERIAEELIDGGTSVLIESLDTADTAAMERLANGAREEFGTIDVWVNNAGVYVAGKFEETPIEDMRRLMDTNFFGYVNGSRAALEQFRDQGFGTLINVASINAAAPQPYTSVYSASKAAIRALDESLRMELALDKEARKIHVCTVMPAGVDTNLFRNAANYTGKELLAVEPVYSPTLVARRIVALARAPKREIAVGGAGRLMAFENRMSPRFYERMMAYFTQDDALSETEAVRTKGNLYEPIESHRGMTGGWQGRRVKGEVTDRIMLTGLVLIGAAAALGAVLLMREHDKQYYDDDE